MPHTFEDYTRTPLSDHTDSNLHTEYSCDIVGNRVRVVKKILWPAASELVTKTITIDYVYDTLYRFSIANFTTA